MPLKTAISVVLIFEQPFASHHCSTRRKMNERPSLIKHQGRVFILHSLQQDYEAKASLTEEGSM